MREFARVYQEQAADFVTMEEPDEPMVPLSRLEEILDGWYSQEDTGRVRRQLFALVDEFSPTEAPQA